MSEIVEVAAAAHYEAVNLRIHGSVWPKWDQQPQQRRDWFTADMRAALRAVVASAGLAADDLREATAPLDWAAPNAGHEYARAAALLRALAAVAEDAR